MPTFLLIALLIALIPCAACFAQLGASADLRTVAESSDYQATATSEQVNELLRRIADRNPNVHLTEIGRTFEGRAIPLAIIADPPLTTPAEAHASGKAVVLVIGNIHAGEVCGKEALLMLARELALEEHHPLLRDLVILLAPNYNADGNDRFDKANRPGQIGPAEGMGQRPNAQGLDLNRDWAKLEAPETRAMVRALTAWDPTLTIDTHTTNGSQHRYVLTYDAPLNPSGYEPSIAFVRDELLPAVTERLLKRTGYDTFFYGNFDDAHTTWTTYSADPRFGGPYQGLRGQMSVLSEAYSYAPYRDRVLATLEFVREILDYAVEHRARLLQLHEAARADTIARGRNPQPDDVVGLRHEAAAWPAPVLVKGYALSEGVPDVTAPMDHRVVHLGRFEATVSVRRPAAYLIAPGHDAVIDVLRGHGIVVEAFEGDVDAEEYVITAVARDDKPFQGHHHTVLDVEARAVHRSCDAGWSIVRTAQPLGNLVVYLLEPQATDGLAAWGFFGPTRPGDSFAALRLPR